MIVNRNISRPKSDGAMIEELKKKIRSADTLVLCKSELFLQLIGGETIDTIYPCARDLALLIGDIFEKEVAFG